MAPTATPPAREPRRYVQRDQPDGVPPLELTGERTLPDVPEENYWFQRHLVVYRWIAGQVAEQEVVDLACGEGYGSAELAARAAAVVGVDANPDAHEHARLRYRRPNLRFERDLVENVEGPCDAVVFLQTIEHMQEPGELLSRIAAALRPGGAAFISTPNVLTLAPRGAERSGNPWHVREYRAEEFAGLLWAHFSAVELHGLFHARMLRAHELAIRLGWDRIHPLLGVTLPFYERFTASIGSADFRLRAGEPARLTKALDFVAVCRP